MYCLFGEGRTELQTIETGRSALDHTYMLKLRFLTHYILFTYFSKLLKLRCLTQYILLTYFSKLLKLIF